VLDYLRATGALHEWSSDNLVVIDVASEKAELAMLLADLPMLDIDVEWGD